MRTMGPMGKRIFGELLLSRRLIIWKNMTGPCTPMSLNEIPRQVLSSPNRLWKRIKQLLKKLTGIIFGNLFVTEGDLPCFLVTWQSPR